MTIRILIGDCTVRLGELPDNSVDSVVCDPPYHLTSIVKRFGAENAAPAKVGATGAYARASKGFMGQTWDGGDVAFRPETWAEVLRVLKPGGHLIAFSGTRTYHRLACAVEDAGFEVRDMLSWLYGSGFPKSHDVSKGIDRMAGAEREVVGPGRWNHVKGSNDKQAECLIRPGGKHEETAPATDAAREWEGWGTALKPACEPIVLARKPLAERNIAANVLAHGTGALNIDGCRIEAPEGLTSGGNPTGNRNPCFMSRDNDPRTERSEGHPEGRWPANVIHDGSDEVVAGFPETGISSGGRIGNAGGGNVENLPTGKFEAGDPGFGDSGSAARYFYCAKATTEERGEGNNHPTVKPVALMRWLVRLITPKGGTVLDPFMGSGSTALACDAEQFDFIGCELSPEYAAIAEKRIRDAGGMFAEVSVCMGEAA
jgi:DNA modification methylase